MHPIEFKRKWKLSYRELALVLGYESEYTTRNWNMPGEHKRNPQNVVRVACRLLDEKWEREGKALHSYL
ncbi:hypothetical protein GNE10_09460 [Nostoc sp. 2RC]|nr:hypothetical protein [Nostoc sp. 2RC]